MREAGDPDTDAEIVEVDKRETVTAPSCECGVSDADAEDVRAEEEKFEAADTMLDA